MLIIITGCAIDQLSLPTGSNDLVRLRLNRE